MLFLPLTFEDAVSALLWNSLPPAPAGIIGPVANDGAFVRVFPSVIVSRLYKDEIR